MAWLPLPFGSNRSWAWNVAGAVIGGCFACGVCWHTIYPMRWSLYAFLGIVLWSFTQALPLWPYAEGYVLAVAPFYALDHSLRLLALGALWMCGFSLSHTDPASARRLSLILTYVGGAWVFLSLLVYGVFPHRVLFWEKIAYVDVLTGPFINRNAAACFFGIVGLSLIAHGSDPAYRGLWKKWYFFGSAAATFWAVLLTESRGGFLAFLVGGVVFCSLYATTTFLRWCMCGVAVFLIGSVGHALVERFLHVDLTHIDRVYIWSRIIENISDFWWSGVGGGGFEYAFMAWRDPVVTQHWDHAHNIYLECVVELGIPGACTLFLIVCHRVLVCWKKAQRHPKDIAPILGLSVMALLGVHGMVDFAPQIPANSLWGVLLFGLGCGTQSNDRFKIRCSKESPSIKRPKLVNRKCM